MSTYELFFGRNPLSGLAAFFIDAGPEWERTGKLSAEAGEWTSHSWMRCLDAYFDLYLEEIDIVLILSRSTATGHIQPFEDHAWWSTTTADEHEEPYRIIRFKVPLPFVAYVAERCDAPVDELLGQLGEHTPPPLQSRLNMLVETRDFQAFVMSRLKGG